MRMAQICHSTISALSAKKVFVGNAEVNVVTCSSCVRTSNYAIHPMLYLNRRTQL